MKKNDRCIVRTKPGAGMVSSRVRSQAVWAAALALTVPVAHGFEIDTGNPDVRMRWDNTVKYSAAWRLEDQSSQLLSDPNGDDGDRNFDTGLISNRLDLLTELDITTKRFGARLSGAAWYDDVYNRTNDNDSPGTINHVSRPYDEFTTDTRNLHGRKGELLDAFLYGKFKVGDSRGIVRLGRHTQLWGESLFFGGNGIAGGMAPIDIVKAMSVPNTQFKELLRPTEQVSGQIQINSDVSVGAYYQYAWDESRLPATGSYFASTDYIGTGTETYVGPGFNKGSDIEASDSGQFGIQLRFRGENTDYGLYAIQYHDKTPQFYINPVAGTYFNVYPEEIRAVGASFSRTLGVVNWAGEVSVRHNMPLASDGQLVDATADNDSNARYAVGRTVHANLSWIASLSPNFIARESSLLGEIAWNRTTSVTKNRSALNPNADRDAWAFRVLYEPTYRQVFSGVDLTVPVGLGYGIGNSSAVGGAFPGDEVGDVSIGVSGTYLQEWNFGLNVTHFFGPEGTFVEDGHASFKQALKDRDFVSVTLSRAF